MTKRSSRAAIALAACALCALGAAAQDFLSYYGPPAGSKSYKLEKTLITWYKTFAPKWVPNKYPSITEKTKIKGLDGNNLRFPPKSGQAVGDEIEITKGQFYEYHLEGSGFIYRDDGARFALNLRDPDPLVSQSDPTSASPDRAKFALVDNAVWGLDAYNAYRNGLVAWRTIAVNTIYDADAQGKNGKTGRIPPGAWVYMPFMKGQKVPVPKDPDNLGPSANTLYHPGTNPEKFDWFVHDGWFRATDVSWSLPDWKTVHDGKWIDMFMCTGYWGEGANGLGIWDWFYYNIAKPKAEYKGSGEEGYYFDVHVYPYAVNPHLGSNNLLRLYNKVPYDPVAGGDAKQKDLYSERQYIVGHRSSDEKEAFGDWYGTREDDALFILRKDEGKVVAYKSQSLGNMLDTPDWTSPAALSVKDMAVGDIDKDGKADLVLATASGLKVVKGGTAAAVEFAADNALSVAVGDFDGNGYGDVAAAWADGSGSKIRLYLNKASGHDTYDATSDSPVRAMSAGNMDASYNYAHTSDGKAVNTEDELVVGAGTGVRYFSHRTKTWSGILDARKVESLAAGLLDPDEKADLVAVFEGDHDYYVRYSTDKAPAFRLTPEAGGITFTTSVGIFKTRQTSRDANYGYMDSVGETQTWTVDVPAGAESLRVQLNCPTGADFDFRAKRGSAPTASSFDFAGTAGGSEDVTFPNPGPGTWYVTAYSYSGRGRVEFIPTVRHNQVVNGDFQDGSTDPWQKWSGFGGASTWSVSSGRLNVAIQAAGSHQYSTQVWQPGIRLEAGRSYEVSFKARASAPRTIRVLAKKDSEPWTAYSANQAFNLGTTLQDYSFAFTMDQATDPNARLSFELGLSTAGVVIDDVKLVEAGGALPPAAWAPGQVYAYGAVVRHQGYDYRCVFSAGEHSTVGREPHQAYMWAVWERL